MPTRIESPSGRPRDLADAVDMAGDDMAAKLVADPERALEVEPRALAPEAGRGLRHGLARDVDREPAVALVDDGQADARAGDRGAEIDARHVVAAAIRGAGRRAPRRLERADVGDDSGEHARALAFSLALVDFQPVAAKLPRRRPAASGHGRRRAHEADMAEADLPSPIRIGAR